jgi:division protein CdvB (Snf7/Vps24/ESCRT-III family)
MPGFEKSWKRPTSPGLSEQISGLFHNEPPLKPRVDNAIRVLNKPISKLESTSNQLDKHETKLFNRIVQAQQKKDYQASRALANELVQVRKTNKIVENMKSSVERTQLKLSTVSTIGDAVVSLQPAVSTMRAIGPVLNRFMPQASSEIESMGNMLGQMMPSSLGNDAFIDSGFSSQETDDILKEAAAVAESKIGSKFPSVPSRMYHTSVASNEDYY